MKRVVEEKKKGVHGPGLFFNEEAERGVLGGMLVDPPLVIPKVMDDFKLTKDSFHDPDHQMVFEVLIEGFVAGDFVEKCDAVLVAEKLNRRDQSLKITRRHDWFLFLIDLMDKTPFSWVMERGDYVRLVKEYALRRDAFRVCRDLQMELGSSEVDPEILVKQCMNDLNGLFDDDGEKESNEESMHRLVSGWRHVYEEIKRDDGNLTSVVMPTGAVATPWPLLTQLSGGIKPGLVLICARPSQGKTTLEDCAFSWVASRGFPVGRVTLDMSKDRLLQRLMCREARVSLSKLNAGFASEGQIDKIRSMVDGFASMPMYFLERTSDLQLIKTWIRVMKIRYDICMCSIDHARLIRVGRADRLMKEYDRLVVVVRELKALSVELNIPIVVINHIGRAGEVGGAPSMRDIKGAGSFEEDANQIFTIYPNEDVGLDFLMKDKEMGDRLNRVYDKKNLAIKYVEVLKNQDGATDKIPYVMYMHYFLFEEFPSRLVG